MKYRVYRESLAELDLLEHVDYLAQERPEAVVRFVDAVEHAFDRIAEMPGIGAPRVFSNPRLHGIRLWPVPEFEMYLIFYQFVDEEIRVLRVLHGARDVSAIINENQ